MHYLDDAGARAAMVAAGDRRFSLVTRTRTVIIPAVAPYRPGEFYRRELPPLRAVIPASDELALIVVDGYVDLDPGGRPGLGAHVHAEYGVPGHRRGQDGRSRPRRTPPRFFAGSRPGPCTSPPPG